MVAPQYLSSLSCELRIIQAKNTEFKSNGNLFVRYYLSTGNNERIRLNTREISSRSDCYYWNESFSLECYANKDTIDTLKQEMVVFELRWRNTVPVIGKIRGSQLLGRAEIPWKDVFESQNMEIEKWVSMVSTSGHGLVLQGLKPPALQVGMRVRVPAMVEMKKKRRKNKLMEWDECGCKDIGRCNCIDYDLFALAAAMEAL